MRKDASKNALERLEKAKNLRDKILAEYIMSDDILPENLQEQAQKLIGNKQRKIRITVWHEPVDVVDSLNNLIERLDKQTTPITNKQREKAWNIVSMMGLPCFQSDGEAEALCAYLAVYGYVDAVLSEDSDVFSLWC